MIWGFGYEMCNLQYNSEVFKFTFWTAISSLHRIWVTIPIFSGLTPIKTDSLYSGFVMGVSFIADLEFDCKRFDMLTYDIQSYLPLWEC